MFVGSFMGQLYQKIETLLDSVSMNIVRPAACARVNIDETPCREAGIALAAVAAPLQEAILRFAAQRLQEEEQHRVQSRALHVCCCRLFKPEYEADVLRPLCILLGYLRSTDANVNLLGSNPFAAGLLHQEGEVALELLHPCFEKPECAKYQVLFDPPHGSTSTFSLSLQIRSTIATTTSRAGFGKHSNSC